MKIAIDESPLVQRHNLAHRVRGTGFYIQNLKISLERYYPKNSYFYFTQRKKIPRDTELVHYPYFEPFFLSLPLSFSKPSVVTVHDLTPLVFPKYFPSGIRGLLKWNIQKFNLKKMSAIITDSESSKKDIMTYANISSNMIHVIYLAASEGFRRIPDNESVEKTRKKYNLPKEFALYVGDATWNKNLPRLIKAIKQSNTPFVMVGKAVQDTHFDRVNPWNEDLVEINKLVEGDKRIVRLGFVPQEDLIALYNLAKIFVMPSLYEGFGLPLLEAMACGCPVITTREGSIPEVVGDCAFFVDAYSIQSIEGGIRNVLGNERLRNSLSKKGLERKKSFSWEKTARKTQGVYESILERK